MTLARAFQALFVLETNGRPVKYLTPFHPSLRPRFSNLRASRFEKFLPKFHRTTRNCFVVASPPPPPAPLLRFHSRSMHLCFLSILFYVIGPCSRTLINRIIGNLVNDPPVLRLILNARIDHLQRRITWIFRLLLLFVIPSIRRYKNIEWSVRNNY